MGCFQQMQVPSEWPDEMFDRIVRSEALHFLSPSDIATMADRVYATLDENGIVLLVNWRGRSGDPCTGDEAAGNLSIGHIVLCQCERSTMKKWYRSRFAVSDATKPRMLDA